MDRERRVTPGDPNSSSPRTRGGFSLAEMVVSLAIVAVLVGSMTSVLLLSLRAIDDRTNPAGKTVLAAEAVDQVVADLSIALSFDERTASAVTVRVPDRTGDGQPEVIRYAWTGVAGEPLIRTVNGVEDKTFACDVRGFGLSYIVAEAPPPVEGPTVRHMMHDDLAGGTMVERNQKSSEWCAQYLKPTFPANAVTWKIESIQLVGANHSGTDGVMEIRVTTADADGKPTAVVLGTTSFYESSLPGSHGWVTIPIGPITGLSPGQGVCIVIRSISGSGTLARWQYESNAGGLTADTHLMTSNDSGSTWSAPNQTMDLRFAVYGTVSTQSNCN